ncbi:MAG: hypothetical protein JO006_09515 [Paucibacter sp.]|nr:hypothetical protein [Roseateles sp.]
MRPVLIALAIYEFWLWFYVALTEQDFNGDKWALIAVVAPLGALSSGLAIWWHLHQVTRKAE